MDNWTCKLKHSMDDTLKKNWQDHLESRVSNNVSIKNKRFH